MWKNLKIGVEESICKKRVKVREKKIGEKDWWDTECKELKREVKKAYREWRKGKEGKEKYLERRRQF